MLLCICVEVTKGAEGSADSAMSNKATIDGPRALRLPREGLAGGAARTGRHVGMSPELSSGGDDDAAKEHVPTGDDGLAASEQAGGARAGAGGSAMAFARA